MLARCLLLGLSAFAFGAQAQLAAAPGADVRRDAPAERSRPSEPSRPSVAGTQFPQPGAAPTAGVDRPHPALLGGGSFGSAQAGVGLENVLNSGTPTLYERRGEPRKVCPPGLENRNNVCAAPLGDVLGR